MSDAQHGPAPTLRSRAEVPDLLPYVADVVSRRHFTWSLATGQLRSRHLDTLLGNLWHVLNPMMLVGVYYLVFGVIIGTNRGVDNFIAFLSIGIFAFSFMQRTVTSCAGSIASNIGLIRSLQFPRAVLPLSTTMVELLGFGFGLVVTFGVLLLTGEYPTILWLRLPFLVLALGMFSAGLGMVVARVTDSVRDLSQVIPYLFRIMLYLSGIIFSLRDIVTEARFDNPELLRELFVLNPFFTYIDILRDTLMTSYSAEHPQLELLFVAVTAPAMFLIGLLVFRTGEKQYGRG